jgi:hypothetical protein
LFTLFSPFYSGVFPNIAIALRFIAVAMLRPLSTFVSGGKFLPDSSNRWKPLNDAERVLFNLRKSELFALRTSLETNE